MQGFRSIMSTAASSKPSARSRPRHRSRSKSCWLPSPTLSNTSFYVRNCDFVLGAAELRGANAASFRRMREQPPVLRRAVGVRETPAVLQGWGPDGLDLRLLDGTDPDMRLAVDVTREDGRWDIFGHWLIDILPRMLIARAMFGDVQFVARRRAPTFAVAMME